MPKTAIVYEKTGRVAKKRRTGDVIVAAPARARSSYRSVGELKNVDVTAVNMPALAATTGTVTLLNGMVPGVDPNQRVGRRTIMRNLYLRLTLVTAATTTLSGLYRFLVVYDKQPNAAALTAALVLEQNELEGQHNLGNSRRFKILVDKTKLIASTGTPQSILFEVKKKMNLPIEFNAGIAGTIADITTGSLYLIVFATGTHGVAIPDADMVSRVMFSDK